MKLHQWKDNFQILMETTFQNIEYRAGGLNHFSILLEAKYKNTGKDGYPIIRKKGT